MALTAAAETLPAARPSRAARRPRSARRGVPLRLRLTLLSAAMVGLTLLVFSVLVFVAQARVLADEVDNALVDRANVINASISVEVTPRGLTVELPDVDAVSSGGAVAQVALFTGDVVRSSALGRFTLPISREALSAARNHRARFEDVRLARSDFRLYNQPLLLAGEPIGILQVARPLDEMQAALARLRLVLAGGAVGSVLLCGLVGLFVARAALRPIDQLTRAAEQIGASQDFGDRVPASHSRRPDEVGRLAATFNAMLDRLQSAYAALQSANKRLEAALESQRRFVADASHELRTPLTTVRGNASLLRRFDTLTPEDREAVVDQIAGEADRMSRLVADLLTLARADAGQRLERNPVPLEPLLDAVAQQGRILADGKVGVSVLRAANVGEGEAVVLGDPDALRQLLLILVDNAIKYTPPGGSVSLGLRVEVAGGSARLAKISVVDTGVGIAPEDQPFVFERFYRADRSRSTGGTGLGLAIGKWIVEAHGGSIAVESAPGAGSIFTVTLPLTPAASPAPASTLPAPNPHAPLPRSAAPDSTPAGAPAQTVLP